MYYLLSDPDDSRDTSTMLKSEDIHLLVSKALELGNVEWSISTQAINWDEEDFILIQK